MIKSTLKTGASWATPPGVSGSNLTQKVIRPGAISETELQKRLKKLEAAALDPSDTVVLTDDQYTLSENVVYLAYASALSNLVNGNIPNQSDATDFQYSPYNAAGVLLAFRGYFSSNSIYASGDPTDYTWESTSGLTGFTSSERYFTTSSGVLDTLGNPIEPGSGITWTIISAGSAIPGTAVWVAERFTVSGVTSGWTIYAVGAYVNTSILQDDSVTTIKIADDAVTADKLANSINTAIAANTAKVGITTSQANAITANTAKVGITTSQANAITANTAKVGITTSQANAIVANTAKVGITTSQITKLNGIETNATADQTQAEINALGITATSVDLGNWTITESSGTLFFATSGTNKMKLEANGNLTCVGTVTENGTI
tara:strand:- start:128 stop:1258 length:1131 start_codon:yes stop_codon:yes gene_type:complete